MSGKAVKSAIDALDGTISGSAGAGKTLTAFSQTDGKVSATFGSISITKSQVSDFPSLATVATSGSYNDLSNKPTIPTVPTNVSAFTNDAGYLTSFTETDPIFSASAAAGISSSDITAWNGKSNFSGSYNDLTDKPTIPTVNDATLTIQKNSTNVATFTANASSNVTADISVPTKVSDLTNDSGFITGVTSTPTPTASTISEFDSSAHINSADMSAQDVSDFVDALDASGINAVAYVIEKGTNNGWEYRKWSDYTYEAWKSKDFDNLTLTSQSAGTYYGADKTDTLPSFSASVTSAFGQTNGGALSSGIYLYRIQHSPFTISFRAHASVSNGAAGVDFYIRGTWT